MYNVLFKNKIYSDTVIHRYLVTGRDSTLQVEPLKHYTTWIKYKEPFIESHHHLNLTLYLLVEELGKEVVFLAKQTNGLPSLELKALVDLELSVQQDEPPSLSQMVWILHMMESKICIWCLIVHHNRVNECGSDLLGFDSSFSFWSLCAMAWSSLLRPWVKIRAGLLFAPLTSFCCWWRWFCLASRAATRLQQKKTLTLIK